MHMIGNKVLKNIRFGWCWAIPNSPTPGCKPLSSLNIPVTNTYFNKDVNISKIVHLTNFNEYDTLFHYKYDTLYHAKICMKLYVTS